MSNLGRGNRLGPALDAVQEISLMIVTLVQVNLIGLDHGRLERFVAARIPGIFRFDPAVGALETREHPVGIGNADQLGSACIPRPEVNLRRRIEQQPPFRILGSHVLKLNRCLSLHMITIQERQW